MIFAYSGLRSGLDLSQSTVDSKSTDQSHESVRNLSISLDFGSRSRQFISIIGVTCCTFRFVRICKDSAEYFDHF